MVLALVLLTPSQRKDRIDSGKEDVEVLSTSFCFSYLLSSFLLGMLLRQHRSRWNTQQENCVSFCCFPRQIFEATLHPFPDTVNHINATHAHTQKLSMQVFKYEKLDCVPADCVPLSFSTP